MSCHGWLSLFCLVVLLLAPLGCRGGAREADLNEPALAASPQWEIQSPADTHSASSNLSRGESLAEQAQQVITPVRFVQEAGELPLPADADPEVLAAPPALQLRDVVVCVQQSYPLLVSALLERQIADGKQLTARAHSI